MDLDRFQWIADPPADACVAAILDGCNPVERARRVDSLNAAIRGWQGNAAVAHWRPPASVPADIAAPLRKYLDDAHQFPAWGDRERIARAEQTFMDYGALSVTMLFCASLPECYVVPDLAAVLHATGQLEDRAEHRIRTTGAMIFPVMMHGGLTQPDGAGIAQILKVRLIHATIRNLVLRGAPEHVAPGTAAIPPLLMAAGERPTMTTALAAHGWDLRCGLPNNQEELAYTLLTFSYVFLRAMRRLGIPMTQQQEHDYLHVWNVAGHYLGIRRELMVETMEDAEALFERMQARGRADWAERPLPVDPRPELGAALMNAMKTVMPPGAMQSFPVLLTRRLMEPASVRDLGLDGAVSRNAKFWFALLMGGVRGIDATMRLAFPDFSISRLLTRVVGYRLTCALLMSQTRELAVPTTLRPGIQALVARWGNDPKASSRMNALEDRFTTDGAWESL